MNSFQQQTGWQLVPPSLFFDEALETPIADALDEAMTEAGSTYGAVASMNGNDVRIVVAEPDSAWLRSVDHFITRSILSRRGAMAGEVVAANDRSYRSIWNGDELAVIILAGA